MTAWTPWSQRSVRMLRSTQAERLSGRGLLRAHDQYLADDATFSEYTREHVPSEDITDTVTHRRVRYNVKCSIINCVTLMYIHLRVSIAPDVIMHHARRGQILIEKDHRPTRLLQLHWRQRQRKRKFASAQQICTALRLLNVAYDKAQE